MRQILFSIFISILSVIPSVSLAVETITGEINTDLSYQNAVLLQGVTLPNDLTAQVGSSTIKIGGTGTITISSRGNNGFPKMMILGGTTITSTRSWGANEVTKSWWQGQLDAPSVGRKPTADEISFVNAGAHALSTIYAIASYQLGISNEVFTFSTPIHVAFPIQEVNGTKIWIATNEGGAWKIAENSFCIIENGVCVTEFTKFSGVVFVKENLQTCPNITISNGTLSGAPNCILQCNRGYMPDENWANCVAVNPSAGIMNDVIVDNTVAIGTGMGTNYNSEVRSWRHGYFRYRDTRAQSSRFLDENLVEGAALERVRRLNDGYLSRNPKTPKAQLCEGDSCGGGNTTNNDSFMHYMLNMRNVFGNSANSNNFVVAENKELPIIEGGKLGAGYRLPSTGPSIFIVLVALGLGTMVFNSIRRRN